MSCSNDSSNKNVKWSPDDIVLFLETFHKYELLWNIRHEDYSNKTKRETNLLKLKEDLLCQGLVVPDITFLRARIRNIRLTYKNELTKVISSKASGAGTDDVYTPKLLWFKTADSFLNDVVVTRQSQSNLKCGPEEADTLEDQQGEVNECLHDDGPPFNSTENEAGTSVPKHQFATPAAKKRRITTFSRVERAIDKLQNIVSTSKPSSSNQTLDQYDAFAQHISLQLRQLPFRSFVMLQEQIQSLISKEMLKNLLQSPVNIISTSPSGSTSSYQSSEEECPNNMDSNVLTIDGIIDFQ
ncbi:uncharacterized protein LOC125178486 [Hyalella azteca]|uniref:Uncharacterized protein LOC125178486 n=1 Tax=Hyalella azteca TaxID=294128 RepID=A0A979FP57_HYAAZ|nr:uncharacterized protein LOC125178486 [Hyalella azteca]